MPTALENLVKILKLEKQNGFDNKAVIGGLQAYAPNWAETARAEAKRTEQYALIEEILLVIAEYDANHSSDERQALARYIHDRITRRVEADPRFEVDVMNLPDMEEDSDEEDDDLPHDDEGFPHDEEDEEDDDWPDDVQRSEAVVEPTAPKPRRKKREISDLEETHRALRELDQPITVISGVGDKMAEKLARLGVQTLRDALYLLPRRYDDYRRMVPLSKVAPFENYTVIGTIQKVSEQVMRRGLKLLKIEISDGSARLNIQFFNQHWLGRQLKPGMQIVFAGKTELFLGKVVMNNPAWEPVDQKKLHTGGIVPIYPLTKGISARTMRRIMDGVIKQWAGTVPDYLPESVLDRADQVDLGWALQQVHFPEKWEYIAYARERLAFDELLLLQLGVMARRTEWQSAPAMRLDVSDEWINDFQDALPFSLTNAQKRAIDIIRDDMATDIPMNRLLQGDVGSGKTLVALVTLAMAALNNKQAALMAPTSILAEQHYQNISALYHQLPGLENCRVALLTGSASTAERNEVYEGLADGSISLVIGTHAIIQQGVEFANLAVAVIDEQHRFGVHQRGLLRGKGTNPHLLVMSATPIPRTLALTLFADLDLTILDEMPPGRTPIQTRLLNPSQRTKTYLFIEDNTLKRGQQAYVIYPLVEASDVTDAESAVEGYEFIQNEIYPNYRVGLIHGRMTPTEKDEVMAAFSNGDIEVLVSTSVIEVGVDVPNATAIIIENAERFGLAQLHQFRGRVGRGDQKSYCILISEEQSVRLQALENTTDGFELAELDWRQRGAGSLLGVRQSGSGEVDQIRLAEAMDVHLVELAQQESKTIYAEDPELMLPDHALMAQRVITNRDSRSDLS
jgi:ATP-dependent DNA helicase RecG